MYETVYTGDSSTLVAWNCDGHIRSWSGPEPVPRPEIVVPLGGVFVRRRGSEEVVATPLMAAFANAGDEYRIRHPVAGGDRGVALVLCGEALEELAATGLLARRRQLRLPSRPGRVSARLALRLRTLTATRERRTALELEELAVELAIEALTRRPGAPPRLPRPATARRRTAAVVRGLEYVHERYREPISVSDVARAAAYSPFHFSRLFRTATGVPVHRYVRSLRLRAAADRLLQGEENLSSLAHELGFSSHAHFTDAFRQEFAVAPSRLRRGRRPGEPAVPGRHGGSLP